MRKRNKQQKRKLTPSLVAARLLIGVGLFLMLFALGYEAANYPWHILWQSDEELNRDTLPDPTPPAYDDGAVPYVPQDEPEDLLPGADALGDMLATPDRKVIHTVLGYIKIPKLGISINILDGYTQSHLLWGAGHVGATPMPDQPGNVCISAHRITRVMHPFRHLDKMKDGDLVYIHYQDHVYEYATFSLFPIGNKETWVMQPVDGEPRCLTLITCHPPGSARQRLVLRARLVSVDGQPPEDFFDP